MKVCAKSGVKNVKKESLPRLSRLFVLFELVFALFVDGEEIGIGVFVEKPVEILVKFVVESAVAGGAMQGAMVDLGGVAMSDEVNVMKLNDLDGEFAVTDVAAGILLIEQSFYFFTTRPKIPLPVVQHPFLFLLHSEPPQFRPKCEQLPSDEGYSQCLALPPEVLAVA